MRPEFDPSGHDVCNTMPGIAGAVLQAGVVRGGVHLHATPPQLVPVVPRQLPAVPGLFAGRVDELDQLDRALTAAAPNRQDTATQGLDFADLSVASAPVMVSAIGGAGGIGKTWLVLAWAHRHLHRFPDGQLFVDLHGFSPAEEPMTSGMAVRGFLDALEVDPSRIPSDLDSQAALYRSLVAGRRMLVVLDNAATAEQVVPLLPGSPTCTVLVTGRHRLASLIDRHGARHVALDVLARDEARALLAARLGADRVGAELGAVDELVELCGGYPLALSITARNACTQPDIPLAEVAVELRELGLDMLDHGTDPAASLPAVLSWSQRWLTDTERTVFGLLGIAPGPHTTLPAVAALTGFALARTRKILSALVEASLLERRSHGRYAMHDLVRDYAAATARSGLPDDVLEAALIRVMDFYSHTAHAADRLLDPHRPLLPPQPAAAGVDPLPLPDAAAAMTWLEAEHATLLATQRIAVALGRHHVVWHLAWALDTFHFRRWHGHEALIAWRAALNAAEHLPDTSTLSRAYRLLGRACSRLGLHDEAFRHLDQALVVAALHRNPTEQAHTHQTLAVAWGRRGDDRQALHHARQARDLHRALDHPVWEANALNQMGRFAARLGDLDAGRDHCRSALTLHRHHHNFDGEAATLDSIGLIAYRAGDHRQAVVHYHQALTLYRTLGHTYQVADTLERVGHPHAALGQYDEADRVWREALEMYRQQGRDTEAQRAQQQLDDLDKPADTNPGST